MTDRVPLTDPATVHIVSHGPHCLDGVAAAAAIARFYERSEIIPRFSGNEQIDSVIQGLELGARLKNQELWITDISWTAPETDRYLRELAARGLRIIWIDHHRTAIRRLKKGKIDVPFAHHIVDDSFAASKLVYDYLTGRARAAGVTKEALDRFHRVVEMADDNDRWIHEMAGSWDLALTLRSMDGAEAFDELVTIDEQATYSPRMQAAFEKVDAELRQSSEIAGRTRSERDAGGVKVVSAVCDGYPSEIGDRWGKETPNAVFVFFDLRSGAISYRRSPDCEIDLSRVAETFGGGGHPSAAGSSMPELLTRLTETAARKVAEAVRLVGKG